MNKKGFTLIELLIVVAIIGILAAIAIPGYLGAQAKAKRNSVKENAANFAKELQNAASTWAQTNPDERYMDLNGDGTPQDLSAYADLTALGGAVKSNNTNFNTVLSPYATAATDFLFDATGTDAGVAGHVYLTTINTHSVRVTGYAKSLKDNTSSEKVYDQIVTVE